MIECWGNYSSKLAPTLQKGDFVIVRCCKPFRGGLKLSSDGCSKGNPGPGEEELRSILQYWKSDVLWA